MITSWSNGTLKTDSNVHSNRYTLLYAAALSVVTAVLLAVAAQSLKPAQEANVALEKKANILRAVRLNFTDRQQIETAYAERVREQVIDGSGKSIAGVSAGEIDLSDELTKEPSQRRLALYVYTHTDGKKYYVVPLRGTGLWGPIWGYVSLANDFDTVYGAYFDHKGETPGLGAEIAQTPFQEQFQGKKIRSGEGQFVSVRVLKPTDKLPVGAEHRVDGISGGTITSRGTDVMLRNCLLPYLEYFDSLKKNPTT